VKFLWLNELVANGVAHQVGGRPQFQFAHCTGAMRLDRLDADIEPLGYFLVDASFRNLLDDFAFASAPGSSNGCGSLSGP
jgi:hypothetical protein